MKTRVLMFGWEFPPHIAGGLGTACLGLTRGLAKQGVEVLFVMPAASLPKVEPDGRSGFLRTNSSNWRSWRRSRR